MGQTLLEKVWDCHRVKDLANGQTQLFVGLHLVHEVTSPQAFDSLRSRGWAPLRPDRTVATLDHILPTEDSRRPLRDALAEDMVVALERNCREFRIPLLEPGSGSQGIVHVIGPELGLTQPGMTIVCGDSHTTTHGAFGAIAFGIGTSQIRDVLASQCVSVERPRVRRIVVSGRLSPGVYAKDVILEIIRRLGAHGGTGYAYEFTGTSIHAMNMEERMTVCNMAVEGGARIGYVNPDAVTCDYLAGRPFAPTGSAFERACTWWRSMASDPDARFDDEIEIIGADISPVVTWGLNPAQSVRVTDAIPSIADLPAEDQQAAADALQFMGLRAGSPVVGTRVDVAFIGSCTNARLTDLREAARVAKGRRVAAHVRALVVPGSERVKAAAEQEGLDVVFRDAGFEWRSAGCSMCIGLNPDRLQARQVCASSSNRNFKGRQGDPDGRTILMSPAMVAAAAIAGEVTDARSFLQ